MVVNLLHELRIPHELANASFEIARAVLQQALDQLRSRGSDEAHDEVEKHHTDRDIEHAQHDGFPPSAEVAVWRIFPPYSICRATAERRDAKYAVKNIATKPTLQNAAPRES